MTVLLKHVHKDEKAQYNLLIKSELTIKAPNFVKIAILKVSS